MRLSWNEIRSRAAEFASEWAGEGYEKGQTQLFYEHFLEMFGVTARRVASFEEPVKKLGNKRGYIDLFWKGVLLVEQKSKGKRLTQAKEQAFDYFPGIKEEELPRFLLVSDFQNFELFDLDTGEEVSFKLADLPKHVDKFGFILGIEKRSFKDQDPVNIKAAELVGKLHDALKESGYIGHDLERFLVRIVFCLFADDTGIFEPRGSFLELLENRTNEDGSDLGGWLSQLFDTLNRDEHERLKNIDEDLARFPYVNGELFSGAIRIPSFDAKMRKHLVDACQFNWSDISPAIFGSLFQFVTDKNQRRVHGIHYTTEKNILKVIEPLFLNDLRAEFQRLKNRKDSRRQTELLNFQKRLSDMTFFDPACGCGNFLIIAYRELRLLEIEILKELYPDQKELGPEFLSLLDVDQFYGIELGEFPVRVAETALWMMDHIMNNRLSIELGQIYVRIPLRKSPHIIQGDALEMDWTEVLPPEKCSYVFGNPPFFGAKLQSNEQREQVRRIANLGKSGGTLDYVTAWFIKAGKYINESIRVGFVATNSITQGEQVGQLWPILFERCNLDIIFAHRSFAWGSDARGAAHVHVVILGLAKRKHAPHDRILFSYDNIKDEPHESIHRAISPYLLGMDSPTNSHIIVHEAPRPLNGLPPLSIGSQPVDDGNYIFNAEQKAEFLKAEPDAEKFMRPYVGARELIDGVERWILALQNANPSELRQMPKVIERMRAVKDFRSRSKRKSTLAVAEYPEKYSLEVIPTAPFLVVPRVSTSRRDYIPIGWLEPPIIPSDATQFTENTDKSLFGLLTSAMHMSWMHYFGGRLGSGYRYSLGMVYNTFPVPKKADLTKLEPYAETVLKARAKYPNETLADLYDPDTMPTELRSAHKKLDQAVDHLYRRNPFANDRERIEHLLALYKEMTAPLAPAKKIRKRRRKFY